MTVALDFEWLPEFGYQTVFNTRYRVYGLGD